MPTKNNTKQNNFKFSNENLNKIKEIIARYPPDQSRSAILPLLDLAQRQSGGWLPQPAIEHVADILSMPPIRVYEVASFYSMFNLKPVGKHLIQICRTTPCWLRGSDTMERVCKKVLGTKIGDTKGDFTVMEVECLGACVNAPVVQINDDYYEDLDEDSFARILNDLKNGKKPTPGTQLPGRHMSSPHRPDQKTSHEKSSAKKSKTGEIKDAP